MVKAPRAGAVKTRLVPLLGVEGAASLAACFALDTVACARRAARDVFVAYAPPEGRPALEALFQQPALRWLEQRGDGLGARLAAAVDDATARGFAPLLFLGADSPTLPDAYLRQALDALSAGEADVTLGPTDDGGYYAVGTRRPAGELFRGVAWSTPRAYRDTAANAARLNLRLLCLPAWYDVDTPSDLRRLREELTGDHEARGRAPHTCRWLATHKLPPA